MSVILLLRAKLCLVAPPHCDHVTKSFLYRENNGVRHQSCCHGGRASPPAFIYFLRTETLFSLPSYKLLPHITYFHLYPLAQHMARGRCSLNVF